MLLATSEPITRLGLRAVLEDEGIEVVGEEHAPSRVVSEARRLRPDAVLLDLDDGPGKELGERVRRELPQTKVILWARDETVMEVLDPASRDARQVALTAAGGLRSELRADHRERQPD